MASNPKPARQRVLHSKLLQRKSNWEYVFLIGIVFSWMPTELHIGQRDFGGFSFRVGKMPLARFELFMFGLFTGAPSQNMRAKVTRQLAREEPEIQVFHIGGAYSANVK